MDERRLLLVLLDDVPPARLRRAVAVRGDGPVHVHVVAPARVRALQWLATDEEEARIRAEVRAFAAEWTLADCGRVDGEGGDADVVQAVDDALRGFPATEIVLVGASDEDRGLEHSLRELGLPVRRLGGSLPLRARDRLRERARRVAYGRSRATPFVYFVGVNLALALLAVLIALVVVLVVWLL